MYVKSVCNLYETNLFLCCCFVCVWVCVFCNCVTLQTIPVSDVFLTDLVLRTQVLLRLCDGASNLTRCWAKPNPLCTSPLSPLLSCGRKSSQSSPMWSKWLGSRSGHCQQAPEVFVDVCVCVHKCVWCLYAAVYVCVCSLSLIHIWRCRRAVGCRSRWSPYH